MSDWKIMQYKNGKIRSDDLSLSNLSDTNIGNSTDKDILIYNSTTQKYENSANLKTTVGNDIVPFRFHYDSAVGKYGYLDGADTFHPFNDGGGGGDDRLYLVNPEEISSYCDYAASASGGNLIQTMRDTKGNSFWYIQRYNNSACVYSYQTDNHGGCFPRKIEVGKYKRLVLDMEASGRSYAYNLWSFRMSTTGTFSGYNAQNVFKTYQITSYNSTPEAINSQSGIEINTASQYTLNRQEVKIDISEYENDFYVCYHSCDSWCRIYSMYLTK